MDAYPRSTRDIVIDFVVVAVWLVAALIGAGAGTWLALVLMP